VLTPEKVFKISDVPVRFLIIGGGSEACELAAAFQAFGSNVMLVETQPKLLSGWDAHIAEAVEDALLKAGVKVYTDTIVREIIDRNGKPFVVTERGGVLCDKVLVASGRKPDLTSLGSVAGQIKSNNGVIEINEYMETSVQGVYAAGDIAGRGLQTNAACRMAEVAAANAMGQKRAMEFWATPRAVFTTPEAASVGLTEEEAVSEYGNDLVIGFSQLATNVRSMLSGKTEGFVKVLAGRKYGTIYGVHIVGASAAEMISEPAALMRMEVTIHEVVNDIMYAHPTYAEAFAEACQDALGGKK
jgi:dihydrolipoamide dehydrogenase